MRLTLFYLLLFVLQGLLGVLMLPLPSPDLFLLGLLTLSWKLPPWQLVLLGYGAGLLQDLIGHGDLGLHALGLAGAMLAASLLKVQSQRGFLSYMFVTLAALLGKWLVFAALLAWLAGGLGLWAGIARVAPLDILFTLLGAMLILPWAEALRGARRRGLL
jgi:rod shape-determining protein MreD